MKKLIAMLLVLLLLFSLGGCNIIEWLLEEELPVYEGYKEYTHGTFSKGKYTILVYLNGSDLESNYGMATEDLIEMIEAVYDRDDIRVVVQTGGTRRWQNSSVPNDRLARFLVTHDDIELLHELPAASMGESDTLTDFINFGMRYFPADRYGLIFWNHGGGSVSGYAVDEIFDYDGLSLAEINTALLNSTAAQTKLEFIGFDACLMASVETAYIAKNYAHYLVASEELEPGYGWDYKAWLTGLGANPGADGYELGIMICDAYVDFYNTYGMRDSLTMLSVVDLSRIDYVVEALEDFVAAANLTDNDFSAIAKPRSQAHEFGMPSDYSGSIDMVDIVHLAMQYQSMFPLQTKQLIDAVEAAVVYRTQGAYVSNAYGLSMFFPFTGKGQAVARMGVYQTTGFSAKYINFVTDFTSTLTGERLSYLEVPEMSQEGNWYDIYLSPEELANMSAIFFTVWIHIEDDLYVQIYEDSFVEISESGQILTQYDGAITTINDEIACLYEVERGEDYIRFAVPAVLNGEQVNLIVIYDNENPEGKVLGALPLSTDEHDMAPRQLIDIVEGDVINLTYYAEEFATVGEEHDGDYDAFWFDGPSFTVVDGLLVENWEVEEGTYLYGFTIVDLQGYVYYTDFIEVSYN